VVVIGAQEDDRIHLREILVNVPRSSSTDRSWDSIGQASYLERSESSASRPKTARAGRGFASAADTAVVSKLGKSLSRHDSGDHHGRSNFR
jgi:hypothetical protein